MSRTRPHRLAILLPPLVLASCSDAAGPAPPVDHPVTVALSADMGAPRYFTAAEGSGAVECMLDLRASAQGEAGGAGEWRRLVLHYYAGPDWSSPVDSLVVNDLASVFGKATILSAQEQRSGWRAAAGIPFGIRAEVRYFTAGRLESATAPRVDCGPQPVPGAGPPTLTGVSLEVGEGGAQPGGSLVLSWSADVPAGQWESGILEEGGATRLLFPLSGTSDARTVAIPLDGEHLGRRLRVMVFVRDRAGRIAHGPVLTSPEVADSTPPLIESVSTRFDGTRLVLGGQFGAGDPLTLQLSATDNHRVSHLVYEAAGTRDSVELTDGATSVTIPTRAEWAGTSEFRVHVRDVSGNRSEVHAAAPGAMWFYPVRNVPVTVAEGRDATELVVDEAAGTVWTAGQGGLQAFDGPDLATRREIPFQQGRGLLELTVTGDSLVAAIPTGLVFVDLRRGEAVTHAPLPVALVYGLRVAPDGEVIVLARVDGDVERTVLIGFSPSTGEHRVIAPDLTVPHPDRGVVRSGDRRRMVIGSGCVYEAAERSLGACVSGTGRITAGNAGGSRWAGHGVVYDAALRSVLGVDGANGAAFVDGSDEVLFVSGRGPLRVRISDGRIIERYEAPGGVGGLRLGTDGRSLVGWTFAGRVYRLSLP